MWLIGLFCSVVMAMVMTLMALVVGTEVARALPTLLMIGGVMALLSLPGLGYALVAEHIAMRRRLARMHARFAAEHGEACRRYGVALPASRTAPPRR